MRTQTNSRAPSPSRFQRGMVVRGGHGSGKSYLARLAASGAAKNGNRVVWIMPPNWEPEPGLAEQIQQTNAGSVDEILMLSHELGDCDLIVIDSFEKIGSVAAADDLASRLSLATGARVLITIAP